MNIVEFSWQTGLIGGAFIGLAVVTLMATSGRIAGISSIFSSLLKPTSAQPWQWTFIAGLLLSGLLFHWLYRPITLQIESHTSILVIAGLLVGFGTRLGNGCTSGHGVCGISRLSPRSLVATLVFITVGMLTVFLLGLFQLENR
ncbi:MAG: YeeE/YedE thiosulfate transporter family protein [Candidatus Competibacteraceae bacterium]|jgi:uncharacterized membrane protein YedE/YeeE|nr:YeeE/YedE thiosulfate transporter family protein [Candidatus Competibacteraceae bacterium]